jgi:LmbE family N-acetylglucosaminyl deacetylase
MSLFPWSNRNNQDGRNGRNRRDGEQLPPLGADGPMTLMAIMAHPDDIDFGSAGSIAKWCSEGWTVYYVLATSGDKGTHDPNLTRQELAAIREEEQRAAARVLGVKEVIFLGYPDGFLEATMELRGEIVRLLREYKPDVVLTWDAFRPSFNHQDHRNIGIATRDAVFPAVRDHLYYAEDGLGEHRVNELLLAGAADPDYFVDISAFIEKKVDAMLSHASQVSTRDRDEMLKRMREQGQRRGGRGPSAGPGRGTVESFKRVRVGRPPQQQREQQAQATQPELAPVGAGQSSS